MNLIILGPPGSGKGTYAARLQAKLGVPVLATGDIFREMAEAKLPVSRKIQRFMSKGELVPDETAIAVLKDRLLREEFRGGFILDGYPRTVVQARALEEFSKISAVIHLVVPEWIIVERLSSRRICEKCGKVYNLRFLKPEKEDSCDKCGGTLLQRVDDTPKTIKERLKVYAQQTKPLLEYYAGLVPFVEFRCERIDFPPEEAVAEIVGKLKKLDLARSQN
jgi:adenylate kinase